MEETEVQEEEPGGPRVDQAILQAHRQLKDMMEVIPSLIRRPLEEAEVLLKLVRMVLLLKVVMVEMELHLLYLVLQ
jgi:hypothetical protein